MEELSKKIKLSKNYSSVSDDTIENFVLRESQKFKKQKEIEKSVKTKLHTQSTVFFDEQLKRIDPAKIDFESVLEFHTSTFERKNFKVEFFDFLKENLKEVKSVCDIACGLNPIDFCNFFDVEKYLAIDVNFDCKEILQRFFKVKNIEGKVEICDVTKNLPKGQFDVVLLFKFLPLLESQKKGFSKEIFEKIKTNFFVVSYPTKTLSGKNVGMAKKYTQDLEDAILPQQQIVAFKEFENEIVFVIKN